VNESSSPTADGLMRHFTITLGENEVPQLLARVRDAIIARGDIHVYDITFSAHHDGLEFNNTMTVYYSERDTDSRLETDSE
jgi:hypothetical protein